IFNNMSKNVRHMHKVKPTKTNHMKNCNQYHNYTSYYLER
ncbi:hypothetical protein CIHG_10586, partial [Coccidioides immitis H538.4]